jgi:hypothetical protein
VRFFTIFGLSGRGLGSGAAATLRHHHHAAASRRLNAIFFLDVIAQLLSLLERQVGDLVAKGININLCHGKRSFLTRF